MQAGGDRQPIPGPQRAFSAGLEAVDPRLRLGDMLPAVIFGLEFDLFISTPAK